MIKTDFLVIGSGIAGLNFACKMGIKYPDRSITLITKDEIKESNTQYAQGGIAVVMDALNDDFEKHINDTLVAGDGLCDKEVVKMVVEDGPKRLQELIDIGTEFDRDESGEYHLGMEGAHSATRILHYKDKTGAQIQESLIRQVRSLKNVSILEHHFAIDLITQHHFGEEVTSKRPDTACYGAYVLNLDTEEVITISAKATILASGGAGQIYNVTTNPEVATGDGIGMAYRAKARVKHMQFVQFHPTALFGSKGPKAFLISEAVRGFGAILKLKNGQSFMEDYDERGSLASRDIVARAIDTEMKKHGVDHVYLDCRHLDYEAFKDHFPNILKQCEVMGIDIRQEMIPVAPAAHYLCGGVITDKNGQTTISNLYCCGEAAHTGLHGANRLASNSLLEALIYSHNCFSHLAENFDQLEHRSGMSDWRSEGTTTPKEWVLINENKNEIKQIMSTYVGIVRSNVRLDRALRRLEIIYNEAKEMYNNTTLSPQLCELRNMVNVAYLIIRQSQDQQENRGTYYNIDLTNQEIRN